MKTFYVSILMAVVLASSTASVQAQDFYTRYKEADKVEKEKQRSELKRLKQLKETNPIKYRAELRNYAKSEQDAPYARLVERYQGKKLYFIKKSGDGSEYMTIDTYDPNRVLGGTAVLWPSYTKTLIVQKDSTFMLNPDAQFYYCSSIQKEPISIVLNDGAQEIKCRTTDLDYGDRTLEIQTDLGVIEKLIPTSVLTDAMFEEIRPEIEAVYAEKLKVKRMMDEEKENARIKAEQLRREQEAKALEAEREARSRAIAAEEAEQARQTARLTDLKNHYGEQFGKLVFEHKIAVGMNKEAVRESLGDPVKVTVTEKDTSYEYKDRIVIFDGKTGVVSSIVNLK